MSPADRRLIRLVNARVARLEPQLQRAYRKAVEILQDSIGIEETARLIESGQTNLFDEETLNRAFGEFRARLQQGVKDGFDTSVRDLPRAGQINGVPAVRFNVLNDRIRQVIQKLDDKILSEAKAEVRETVRQAIAAGLEDGKHPRAVARGIREVVGLAPNQEAAVRNLRTELIEGRYADARRRQLVDSRFNFDSLAKLPEKERLAKIEKYVASYRKSFEAFHAETVSKTATLQAYKTGQRSSYQAAIDAGIVDRGRARKTWVTVGDERVRAEHVTMNGDTVPFDQPFKNGQQVPGEDEYNCRCLARYSMGR